MPFIATTSECNNACNAFSECKAFVMDGDQWCTLKKELNRANFDKSKTSYIKTGMYSLASIRKYNISNQAHLGTFMEAVAGDADLCKFACDNRDGCVGFLMVDVVIWKGCILKSSFGAKVYNGTQTYMYDGYGYPVPPPRVYTKLPRKCASSCKGRECV